jgi:hypothetical protein
MGTLAEDARALMAAASGVAGEKLARLANVSRPRLNGAKESMARFETKRWTAPKQPTSSCATIPIRPSPSLSVSA